MVAKEAVVAKYSSSMSPCDEVMSGRDKERSADKKDNRTRKQPRLTRARIPLDECDNSPPPAIRPTPLPTPPPLPGRLIVSVLDPALMTVCSSFTSSIICWAAGGRGGGAE